MTSVTSIQSRVVNSVLYCKDPQTVMEDYARVKLVQHRDPTSLLYQNIQNDGGGGAGEEKKPSTVSGKLEKTGNVFEPELGFCE